MTESGSWKGIVVDDATDFLDLVERAKREYAELTETLNRRLLGVMWEGEFANHYKTEMTNDVRVINTRVADQFTTYASRLNDHMFRQAHLSRYGRLPDSGAFGTSGP